MKKADSETQIQQNKQKTPRKLTKHETNEKMLRQLFEYSMDVHFQTMSFGEGYTQHSVTFISCNGLVNEEIMNTIIFERFVTFFEKVNRATITEKDVLQSLYAPGIQRIETTSEIIESVFAGKLLTLFQKEQLLFSIDIANRPQRSPEETNTEVSIKGPRDNFIEDLTVNIALIRKRLRTNSLAIKKYTIGERTQTEVAVLYMHDIVDDKMIQEVEKRIQEIEIDGVFSGRQLYELMLPQPYSFFPTHQYSGRPDFAVHSLLAGRFLILVDGVAYIVIAPTNFALLLKSAEDTENIYLFNSFERLIRILSMIIAVLLPAFYVAVSSYHQNQIPIIFLGTMIESRKGVPLPAPLEAIVMVLLFEFFREAGLRLPMAIGQTLSVVGGLIIGDAAIRAGLASPLMIVVVATSAVATYTLVNISLHGIVSLLRLFSLLFVSFFGFFGFFVSIFLILIYMANIQSYGVPYLAVPEMQRVKAVLKAYARLPEKKYKQRPEFLNPVDKSRQPREE